MQKYRIIVVNGGTYAFAVTFSKTSIVERTAMQIWTNTYGIKCKDYYTAYLALDDIPYFILMLNNFLIMGCLELI